MFRDRAEWKVVFFHQPVDLLPWHIAMYLPFDFGAFFVVADGAGKPNRPSRRRALYAHLLIENLQEALENEFSESVVAAIVHALSDYLFGLCRSLRLTLIEEAKN